MAFYNFITDAFKKKKIVSKRYEDEPKTMTLKEMMNELGVRTEGTIGSYREEEKPDARTISQYLRMQDNDGTVRAITHLFSIPIQSTPIKILAAEGDKGERDFIESVFMKPQHEGGMTTPLPFVIADMTRAIFEGFRLYEKVPQIIKEGQYKGKIRWRKLAPRDAKTVKLRSDKKGGFLGAYQQATFGGETVRVVIPPEKCVLFTFQKEKHPFYGESILKTAYYHYDKKHKLYYLAHKKAEIDAVGLKILKLTKPQTEAEVNAAETAVDSVGVNTRLTLPAGIDLEINRSPTGYDVLKLIEHHDSQMVLSALAQAIQMGAKSTYAYTYGKGYETQSEFIIQTLHAIMKGMEDTLNEWAVAPLIDWNFGSGNYPKIKLMPLKNKTQEYLMKIFEALIKKEPGFMPTNMAEKMAEEISETLGLDVENFKIDEKNIRDNDKKDKDDKDEEDEIVDDAIKAFEHGKKIESDFRKIPAPSTSKALKKILVKKVIELKDDERVLEKFEKMGRLFAINPEKFKI